MANNKISLLENKLKREKNQVVYSPEEYKLKKRENSQFLSELGISQKQLADHIGCDIKIINRIVNNRTSVSAEMAVKLASSLNTSAQFWLNAQQAVDIYNAIKKIKSFPQPITKAS